MRLRVRLIASFAQTKCIQFLSRLLLKFKNTSSEVNTSTGGEPNAFAKQVAEKISICVQSSDEFLNSECPVCLEEPRVEDAVYSEWISSYHCISARPSFLNSLSLVYSQLRAHTCSVESV